LEHVGNPADRVGIQQDPTQNRFFRFQVLGRKRVGEGFEVGLIALTALAEAPLSPTFTRAVIRLGDTHHGSELAPLSHHTLAGREAHAKNQ
jgi:hypothetical protein